MPFRIGNRGYEAECFVSSTTPNIILGCNWLRRQGARWDFQRHRICLNGSWLELERERPTQLTCGRLFVVGTPPLLTKKADERITPVVCLTSNTNPPTTIEVEQLSDNLGTKSMEGTTPSDQFRDKPPIAALEDDRESPWHWRLLPRRGGRNIESQA